MRGECLHKSLWNIEALLLLTISVFGLFLFGYVYIGLGLLKCEWNNAFFFTTYAGLFVLMWVVFLQRNYFYEDEIVVLFPCSKRLMFLLKFLKQKGCPIRREYDDIYSRRVAAAFGPDGEAARVPREEIDLARERKWPSRLIFIVVLLVIIASAVAFWFMLENHL